MLKILKSLLKSTGKGIEKNPEVVAFERKHFKITLWLKSRLDRNSRYGLYLSVGVLAVAVFVLFFLGVIQDIFARDPLALADLRITNLLALFRTPNLSRWMLYVTYLGKWQLVVLGAVLFSIILILFGKMKYFYALVVSVAGGQLLVTILKEVVRRPRPSLANAVIVEQSPSFPSGHTFVVFSFFLLALFMIFRMIKNKFARLMIIVVGVVITVLIPSSRVYLGVHWTSDVLGSVFLGLAWLSALVTYVAIQDKFEQEKTKMLVGRNVVNGLIAVSLIFWIGFSFYFYNANSYEKVIASKTLTTATAAINLNDVPGRLFSNLPRTSEGITGNVMEPINFIFVAEREQLNSTFARAGWLPTDAISLTTTWKIAYSTLFDKPYTTAPGTPSFWDSRPNDFAYERPTASVREREHIHIWSTPYTIDGRPVWLGTAHFDKSVKLTTNFIPTHEINPLVDNERDSLKKQLMSTGKVSSVQEVKIVDPTTGKNLAGSVFYTDGRGYLIAF